MVRKKVKQTRLAPEGGWPTGGKQIPPEAQAKSVGKRVPDLGVASPNVLQRRPVWRFGDLDTDGPWSLSSCSPEDLPDVLAKLKTFEAMRIGEIFAPGSEHGKTYEVESLPKHTLDRLTEIQRDDETEIARLRFSGRKRFYGLLREHVFHVLWWDPKHEVVPSKKKHT